MSDGIIRNEQGQVALSQVQGAQRLVTAGKHQYVFVMRYGVSLAWVEEESVQTILRITGGCCGGNKPIFRYATQSQVNVWTTGNR